MTRRRYFLTICAGWIVLATMRLLTNIAGGALMDLGWGRLVTIILLVGFFWVPAASLILWIDRVRGASRTTILVSTHVALAAIVAAVEPLWLIAVLRLVGIQQAYLETLLSRIDINLLLYAVIVAADVAWLRVQSLKVRELAAARLEQTLVDVQLHGLAIQLQPHFLFNALQFVAETAHDDLATARRTLVLIRGLVEQAFALETRVEVTVAEEISFLRAYGEIQKSRFGDRFSLALNVDDSALEGAIPPLLLQPLVENASRHGFARRGSGGHVEVMVRRTRSGALSIVVADDGVGLPATIKEGQGLTVTRRRLSRLYGSDAHLTLIKAADGRTESRIRLPFHAPSNEAPADVVAPVHEPLVTTAVRNSPFDQTVARIPFRARVAAVWLGLMTLLIGGTYIGVSLHVFWPRALPGLKSFFLEEMVGVPFWIVLTVVAVIAARRLSGRFAVPLHVLLASIIAVSHAALGGTIAQQVFNAGPKYMSFAHWAPWDLLVYAAIVLLARVHEVGAWMRTKMREEVTLNEAVVRAISRLARLRETQSVLLASLDQVIASPTMETLDRAVVDFADFLRIDVMAGVTE